MKLKSKWLPDTRILIGLALIAASFIGVFFVIKTNNIKSQVYIASRPLAVGDKFDVKDFAVIEANLGASLDKYITPGNISAAVFNRPIMPGELLPKSALVPVIDKDLVAVVLRITGDLPGDVREGDLVDVWAAVRVKEEDFWQSELIATTLRVNRVITATGQFDTRDTIRVEVQTARDRLPYLLNAIANQDKISVVRASSGEIESLKQPVPPETPSTPPGDSRALAVPPQIGPVLSPSQTRQPEETTQGAQRNTHEIMGASDFRDDQVEN